MAIGEKRLLALINATVSHEMRNPTNSILSQVNELGTLNKNYRLILDNLKPGTLRSSKKLLEKNHKKHEESMAMQ